MPSAITGGRGYSAHVAVIGHCSNAHGACCQCQRGPRLSAMRNLSLGLCTFLFVPTKGCLCHQLNEARFRTDLPKLRIGGAAAQRRTRRFERRSPAGHVAPNHARRRPLRAWPAVVARHGPTTKHSSPTQTAECTRWWAAPQGAHGYPPQRLACASRLLCDDCGPPRAHARAVRRGASAN